MPRSFLVKKIKGDGFQCSGVPAPTYHPLETAYVLPGARGPPGDNGYAPHCLPPSSYDADQKPGLELAPAEPAYPPAAPEEYSDPESPQSSLSARYFRGEAAVTDSYSMDAFFISDGRSRRRRDFSSHFSAESLLSFLYRNPNLRPKPTFDSHVCCGFLIHTGTQALQLPDHIPTPDRPSGLCQASPSLGFQSPAARSPDSLSTFPHPQDYSVTTV
ncbi:transcriptional repressor scratch 2 [Herpailurus yagouaroundi]|uniref:transcriptional repressor scratch 2 n=1 Tax=Herpailurus yagouaroundi TaxID=1608482 RepID=UPI001AD67A90|nr:transcriptional repressor scratch 2 [Puma yagouaroundi]